MPASIDYVLASGGRIVSNRSHGTAVVGRSTALRVEAEVEDVHGLLVGRPPAFGPASSGPGYAAGRTRRPFSSGSECVRRASGARHAWPGTASQSRNRARSSCRTRRTVDERCPPR